MNQQTMTMAEFGRLCGVTKQAVAKWVRRGVAKLADNHEIHLALTFEAMRHFRRDGVPLPFAALMGEVSEAVPDRAPGRAPATGTLSSHRRDELVAQLRAFDWQRPFDSSQDMHARVLDAAAAVGLEAVTSDLMDDGHWGGYQLRDIGAMDHCGGLSFDAITAGHGFDLDAFEALRECRERILHPDDGPGDQGDIFVIDLALLPALAYPFGPLHKPSRH